MEKQIMLDIFAHVEWVMCKERKDDTLFDGNGNYHQKSKWKKLCRRLVYFSEIPLQQLNSQ